jgi:hypothetical protein
MLGMSHQKLEFEEVNHTPILNRIREFQNKLRNLEEGFAELPTKPRSSNPGIKIDSKCDV